MFIGPAILIIIGIFLLSFIQVHDNFNGNLEIISSVIIYGLIGFWFLTSVIF